MHLKSLPLFCLIFLFFSIPPLLSQTTYSGKIINRENDQPIPFANVVFNQEKKLGTTADLSGEFSFKTNEPIKSLKISHISFETRFFSISTQTENLIISLNPKTANLEEVFIIAEKNPAETIIKKVIKNRNRNNPEKTSSFTFRSYNKINFDYLISPPEEGEEPDSTFIRLNNMAQKMGLMMMESVTERKFIYPNHDEEKIIATKVSGIKNPTFASLAANIQPFSFYKDVLTVLDRNFITPISKGSLGKYEYRLQDTIFQGADTVYVIEFKPKKGRIFDALTGVLYINTHHYAIQNVIAEPQDKGFMGVKIEQKYVCIDREQWFPEQLNFEIIAQNYPRQDIGMKVRGRSFIREVDLNPELRKRDFSMANVKIADDAGKKDDSYWSVERIDSLTGREKYTYAYLDSLGEKYKFDRIMTLAEGLGKERFSLKFVDLDLQKLYVFNEFEGNRVGLGLITNDKISKRFSIGGYGAYGFRDKIWKYGGEANLVLNHDRELELGLLYRNDVSEPGQSLFDSERGFTNFRSYLTSLMDRMELKQISLRGRPFKYATMELGISDYQRNITYDYRFLPSAGSEQALPYNFTDIGFKFRYAYGEKLVESFGERFPEESKYPVFSIAYVKGMQGLLGGQFDYHRVEAEITQSLITKSFGTIRLKARAGMIDGEIPLSNLFFGAGGYDTSIWVYVPEYFQTVSPYEFLSDRYASFFYTQQFPGITTPLKFFKPKISLIHGMSIGTLTNPEKHEDFAFKTMEKGLFESGIIIDQILRLNYVNIAYIGLGGGIFYRYGPYQLPNQKDNLAFKISINFSTN